MITQNARKFYKASHHQDHLRLNKSQGPAKGAGKTIQYLLELINNLKMLRSNIKHNLDSKNVSAALKLPEILINSTIDYIQELLNVLKLKIKDEWLMISNIEINFNQLQTKPHLTQTKFSCAYASLKNSSKFMKMPWRLTWPRRYSIPCLSKYCRYWGILIGSQQAFSECSQVYRIWSNLHGRLFRHRVM